MKQIFFFAAMLISIATAAQQRTSVESVSVDYTTKEVTFNISWAAGSRGTYSEKIYNSKVWVLVDYQEVRDNAPYGSWQRAGIDLTKLPANCTADGTNTKGFWYQGQATAAQNADITITLTGVPAQFKWCAFASDCPPRVASCSGDAYTFSGTPPFTLTDVNGITQQVVSGKTLAHSALTITPTVLTDATGCPGTFFFDYNDCPVLYACCDLPNHHTSLITANNACVAMFGTGWRIPTLSELNCGWARLHSDPSFTKYWYITSTPYSCGYAGCYPSWSDDCTCHSCTTYSKVGIGLRCVRSK